MENERHNLSTKSDAPCLLMGLDGVTYQALLGDLSLTGAMIKMNVNASHGLHVNEMCGLVLRDNPNRSSSKYTGMIVKLDSDTVQISFNQQGHKHQKYHSTPPSS
jgi:hypothetical protein